MYWNLVRVCDGFSYDVLFQEGLRLCILVGVVLFRSLRAVDCKYFWETRMV
jgi:hypothetical protein